MTLMAAARVSAPVFPLVVETSGVTLRDERAGDALARERLLDAVAEADRQGLLAPGEAARLRRELRRS